MFYYFLVKKLISHFNQYCVKQIRIITKNCIVWPLHQMLYVVMTVRLELKSVVQKLLLYSAKTPESLKIHNIPAKWKIQNDHEKSENTAKLKMSCHLLLKCPMFSTTFPL